MHLVQDYLETRDNSLGNAEPMLGASTASLGRKRKASDSDLDTSRDLLNNHRASTLVAVPGNSTLTNSTRSSSIDIDADLLVYNGVLEKCEGSIVAKKVRQRTKEFRHDPTNRC
jgi:hypothetical protein